MPSSKELSPQELVAVVEDFNRTFIRLARVDRLSFSTLSVLHTLRHHGPKRLGELTAEEQVTQPAISQIVTRLEADGLVERAPDPTDGRAVVVRITAAGRRLVDRRRADRVAHLEPLLDALEPAERRALAAALPAFARLATLSAAAHEGARA